MGTARRTVIAVMSEIHGAIDEVRTVAAAEHDAARGGAADWLDSVFADVRTRAELRAAAKLALGLWGGSGSFSDANTAEDGHAIDRLGRALTRARRSWFVREGRTSLDTLGLMPETKTIHIWMLDGRSLCDRRPHPSHNGKSDEEIEQLAAEAEQAPACGACLLLAGRIRHEAAAILETRPSVHPEKASAAWESLRETRWSNYFHLDALAERGDYIDEHTRYDAVTRDVNPETVRETIASWDEDVSKQGALRDQLGGKGPAAIS